MTSSWAKPADGSRVNPEVEAFRVDRTAPAWSSNKASRRSKKRRDIVDARLPKGHEGFLFPAAKAANLSCVPLVGCGIVGIEFKSLLELSLSSRKVPLPQHLLGIAQDCVGTSQVRVQLQCFPRSGVRFRIGFPRIAATVTWQHGIGIG